MIIKNANDPDFSVFDQNNPSVMVSPLLQEELVKILHSNSLITTLIQLTKEYLAGYNQFSRTYFR